MTYGITRRSLVAAALAGGAVGRLAAHATADPAALSWKRLAADGPLARWDHSLSADEDAKRLVLFGGRDASGTALSDTWIFDLSERTWRQGEASGPAPRFGHAVAVDQKARKLILFGGQGSEFFNDTWIFDFDSELWTQLGTGDGPGPSPRYGLPAAFDGDHQVIVSHGFTFEGRFNDTWSLDLSTQTWTERSPEADGQRPLNRCLHEAVWHHASSRLLLFGGCSSGFGPCPQGDLWSFDPDARAWTELEQTAGPSPRSNPAMIGLPKSDAVMIFGGLTADGYAADLWQGIPAEGRIEWSPLTIEGEAPSARASHDLTTCRGDAYLFGGAGPDGPTADLWKLILS